MGGGNPIRPTQLPLRCKGVVAGGFTIRLHKYTPRTDGLIAENSMYHR
jgi:hypothetical protein